MSKPASPTPDRDRLVRHLTGLHDFLSNPALNLTVTLPEGGTPIPLPGIGTEALDALDQARSEITSLTQQRDALEAEFGHLRGKPLIYGSEARDLVARAYKLREALKLIERDCDHLKGEDHPRYATTIEIISELARAALDHSERSQVETAQPSVRLCPKCQYDGGCPFINEPVCPAYSDQEVETAQPDQGEAG